MVIELAQKSSAIAIIQARCSSTRLPGKVLKPLARKPMIWHIVERARECQLVDQVVVATSIESSDDVLANFCRSEGITCHRGSLTNVLSRYLDILALNPHKYVVRITGDCPLIYPQFIDRQIEVLAEHDADMVRLRQPSTLLEGQGVHSSRSLWAVAEQSCHPDDLEHVGSRFFSEYPHLFRLVGLDIPPYFSSKRWRITVDEQADYDMMSSLYDDLYENAPIPLMKALAYLEANPVLVERNCQVPHSAINQELLKCRASNDGPLLNIVSW